MHVCRQLHEKMHLINIHKQRKRALRRHWQWVYPYFPRHFPSEIILMPDLDSLNSGESNEPNKTRAEHGSLASVLGGL